MTVRQARQRYARGRMTSPSFPPKGTSPLRVGMGRPDTSSDQNTGERLLRKPSCIRRWQWGRFIKRLLFQLLFPIFFGVFNQAAREGDKAAFPAEHGMGKFRKRIPREHAGGVITNGPQLHGVCGGPEKSELLLRPERVIPGVQGPFFHFLPTVWAFHQKTHPSEKQERFASLDKRQSACKHSAVPLFLPPPCGTRPLNARRHGPTE